MRQLDLRLDAPGREWKEEEKRWLEGGEEIRESERSERSGRGIREWSGRECSRERLRKCKDSGQSMILGASGGDGGRWASWRVLETPGETMELQDKRDSLRDRGDGLGVVDTWMHVVGKCVGDGYFSTVSMGKSEGSERSERDLWWISEGSQKGGERRWRECRVGE